MVAWAGAAAAMTAQRRQAIAGFIAFCAVAGARYDTAFADGRTLRLRMDSRTRLAARVAEIAPFHVMEVQTAARALEAEGRSVVHMEIGEPDFPTPQPVIEAAQRAIADGRLYYTSALGLPALREAIAQHYLDHYGVDVPAERV